MWNLIFDWHYDGRIPYAQHDSLMFSLYSKRQHKAAAVSRIIATVGVIEKLAVRDGFTVRGLNTV